MNELGTGAPRTSRWPPMTDDPPRGRNVGIDLLGGLSIVLVLMHHTALRIPLEKGAPGDWLPSWFLHGIQYDGFELVFLFFVISGFLITSNSLARWGALACGPSISAALRCGIRCASTTCWC